MPTARPFRRTVLRILAAGFLGAVALAASPRESLLVTPAWLAAHLSDPNLVLLHVGKQEDYAGAHIPGARYVDWGSDLATSDHSGKGLMLEMLPRDLLRQRLAALGIGDDSRVVVYFAKDWVSPSTRVMFTLDAAGLGARSSLLDGGMDAWIRDGHPTTSEVPPQKAGTLAPLPERALVVDADSVKSRLHAPGVAIVDGRAAAFYDGTDTGGGHAGPHKTGHIAGAHSVPFTAVFDDTLHLRPAAELAEIFTKAGVRPDDTVIGYCHIGQQATAMLFAARSLGHPVLLYDGSFEDWSRHDASYPVEGPPAAPPATAPHGR